MKSHEHRTLKRYQVPGTHVYIRPESNKCLFRNFHGPFYLIDISERTISIRGRVDFENMQKLEIWMALQDINLTKKIEGNMMKKEQDVISGEFIYVIRILKK